MAYPNKCQTPQPYTDQEIFEMSQLDSAYLRCCGSYNLLPYPPSHQSSQLHINPICNSAFMGSQSLETWDNSLNFSPMVSEDSPLRIQPTLQDAITEESSGENSKQVISNLEGKVDRLAGLIENLREELEEKTSFFAKLESYILSLVQWTKDSREATDNLVAELKEAVDIANRNNTI